MSLDDPIEFPAEYLAFFDLFNKREFFEAHETLEDIWAIEAGALRDYYKGLIMIAAALFQWRRGVCGGACKLYRSGRAYLSLYPDVYEGFELKKFLAEMDAVFQPLTGGPRQICPPPKDDRLPLLALLRTSG